MFYVSEPKDIHESSMEKRICMLIAMALSCFITFICYFYLSNNLHDILFSTSNSLYRSLVNKFPTNQRKLEHENVPRFSLDLSNNIWMLQEELKYSRLNISKYEHELGSIKSKNYDEKRMTFFYAYSDNYFDHIKDLKNCRTIFFSISKRTLFTVIGARIYTVHSNNCTLFTTKAIRSKDLINLICSEGSSYPYVDIRNNVTLNSKLLYNFKTSYLDINTNLFYDSKRSAAINVGFMHLVKDAKVSAHGDIITGKSYISIIRCKKSIRSRFTKSSKIYKKVFTISQYWGDGYFHFINEDLPRIVFAIPFLLDNKDIKVHVASTSKFVLAYLADLGIDKSRIVSGAIQAKTAYVPGGSVCGQAPIIPVNILSMFLRAKVKEKEKRDLIVLIRRSSKRWFSNHDSILKMLTSTSNDFGLAVKVFGDRPPPTFHETREMFNRAIVVVAPHGAGLSNIIFSEPGICVIEGLCYDGSHKINHCYKHLAQVLGHIYHGVVPAKQCMQMKPEDLAPSVDRCLNHIMAAPK